MSNPPETNLTQKLTALKDLMTTQHSALMVEILLIKTALTSSSGNIDAAPIVSAIQALAGPYPGKTLTDLYGMTGEIKNNIGLPTGDTTTTLLGLLASVAYALTQPAANNATLYAKIHSIMATLILPNTIDNTILGELDAIRLAADPYASPVGACATPFKNNSTRYYPSLTLSIGIASVDFGQTTFAMWPETVPTGFETITTIYNGSLSGQSQVRAEDWLQYKVYVVSTASQFGMLGLAVERYPTNTWINFVGSDTSSLFGKEFFVSGDTRLDVYICPDPKATGGTAPAPTDIYIGSTSSQIIAGRRYVYWPAIDGVTVMTTGRELSPVTDWTGYEVLIQSSAPDAAIAVIGVTQSVIPTNQWVPLGSLGDMQVISFSVDQAYMVQGYMKVPAASAWSKVWDFTTSSQGWTGIRGNYSGSSWDYSYEGSFNISEIRISCALPTSTDIDYVTATLTNAAEISMYVYANNFAYTALTTIAASAAIHTIEVAFNHAVNDLRIDLFTANNHAISLKSLTIGGSGVNPFT
jgi:hypothetical protein